MNNQIIEKLELNKILEGAANFATLDAGKRLLRGFLPKSNLSEVNRLLTLTEEADKLLYKYGVSQIEKFDDVGDELLRAQKGSTLNCAELIAVGRLLRSSRLAYSSVNAVKDENITLFKAIVDNISFDDRLEKDIEEQIISDNTISDRASDELYIIRTSIRNLNEKIRSKLSSYLTGEYSGYLQDGIITMRDDRFVLPVKSEHKLKVRGFVHDRSASGSTLFIEPEQILEMNNELKGLYFDEKQEIERILHRLTVRVGFISKSLELNSELLAEMDSFYARAIYSYKNKCSKPAVCDNGYIDVIKGRHPLIDASKVVPVSISFGGDYNFLLISGPNTGGKTVTLKMCGLFSLMTMCGMFIPAQSGSTISVFDKIFCDVGDMQSIEADLSTFSSHIANIVGIVRDADDKSLALIDELGGGTDPEEGQALAKAIISNLLRAGCKGVITTHFTSLKEFAYQTEGIENACMEFDANTLQPLYRIKIGLPGSSNAIAISRRLGLPNNILDEAVSYMSESGQAFESIVRRAEESRVEAEKVLSECKIKSAEWQEKTERLKLEREKFDKERERFLLNSKIEAKRLINEASAEANEYLQQLTALVKKAEEEQLEEADLFAARALKNKLNNMSVQTEEQTATAPSEYKKADVNSLNAGDRVFVARLNGDGIVVSVNRKKGEAEVQCKLMRVSVKIAELSIINEKAKADDAGVQVIRKIEATSLPVRELKVIGMTVADALEEVEAFIDRAVIDNLEEVKIIHGIGTGRLRAEIRTYLRRHKNVADYRAGVYGEGESGVTIVKLK